VSTPSRRSPHEQNRASWNAVTAAHNSHKRDQASFLAAGKITLFKEELELLGDVDGRRVAHLQCNCGQDSLSLVNLGARVTGIDIADDAIAFARRLAQEAGLPAEFVRSDLFDWFDTFDRHSDDGFDIAMSTYGTIGWLSDIERWAHGVSSVLRPGGHLALLEFHPLIWSFDASGRAIEPYFIAEPLHDAGVNDYVGTTGSALSPSGWEPGVAKFENPEPTVSRQWTVAQILSAIADAGLRIEVVREYPYTNGCRVLDGMHELPDRRFELAEETPSLPLMFGVRARKPG
jgi:SAM-dependent methyltransferase